MSDFHKSTLRRVQAGSLPGGYAIWRRAQYEASRSCEGCARSIVAGFTRALWRPGASEPVLVRDTLCAGCLWTAWASHLWGLSSEGIEALLDVDPMLGASDTTRGIGPMGGGGAGQKDLNCRDAVDGGDPKLQTGDLGETKVKSSADVGHEGPNEYVKSRETNVGCPDGCEVAEPHRHDRVETWPATPEHPIFHYDPATDIMVQFDGTTYTTVGMSDVLTSKEPVLIEGPLFDPIIGGCGDVWFIKDPQTGRVDRIVGVGFGEDGIEAKKRALESLEEL